MSNKPAEQIDYPGLNPMVLKKIGLVTKHTCSTFMPSRHGNAYERLHGEDAICVECGNEQWRHWLKQMFSEAGWA